jgi:hypothetical protein
MIITAIDKHIFGREKMGFIQWKVWYMYLLFRVFVMLNVKECLGFTADHVYVLFVVINCCPFLNHDLSPDF